MDNFANVPKTLGELRSDKSQNGSDWTARDMLIDLLRAIDKGEYPDIQLAVIVLQCKEGGTWRAGGEGYTDVLAIGALMKTVWHLSRS